MLPYRRRLEKKNTLTGESRYLAEASREQERETSGKSVIRVRKKCDNFWKKCDKSTEKV